jgi:hypothetical protein
MSKKPPRPRAARRAAAQASRRAVERVEKLGTHLPGGAPERPLRVTSASVIEVRARGMRCLVCDGELELRAHVSEAEGPGDVRRVELACRACGRARRLWFRVEESLAN